MHLCNIRNRIQKIALTKPVDTDFLLESIGQYLYTLQEFYSNTNWVELNGITVNENLGINDWLSLHILRKLLSSYTED